MLVLGNGISIWMLAAVFTCALVLIVHSYRGILALIDYGRTLPRVLLGLRIGVAVLLVLLLGNPILRVNSAPRDSQRIAIVVDTSRSMGIHDSIGNQSRFETAERILREQGLLSELSQLATTRLLGFDTKLHPLDTFEAKGESSDLFAALTALRDESQAAPLAAVVLFTDGCETGAKSASEIALGVPVYAVGLGSLHEALLQFPDVAIDDLKADKEAFVHTQIEVKLELRETQLAGERVTVQLLRGEQVLAEDSVELKKDTTQASLHFTAEQPGLYDLEARVVPHPKEKITENNSRFFAVRVSGQKIRVFYYEGTPRWTYKFLTRELKRDPQIALQALLRTNVDAIYHSSTSTDNSGPLFPATREALKNYDCIILGDLHASDLSSAQVEALKAHISEDGGGLILLAGHEAFSAAGLPMLGLDALMPASLASVKELTGTFASVITRDGSAHPALGGIDKLLPVQNVYALGEPRSGAQVLARAEGEKGSYPLALAQRYGNGRVFSFASDSDWNWPMKFKSSEGDTLYGRFWGQVIRWAANRQLPKEEAGAMALTTDKELYKIGETVHVYATGTDLTSVTSAGIALPLSTGQGRTAEKPPGPEMIPFNKSGDRLEARYLARQSGIHRIIAHGAAGEFLVERPLGEFDRIALNDTLLRQLAASSGGRYFDALTARTIPETLKKENHVKTEIREYIFADSWLPFILLVATLSAEWALRKRMQMV